MSIAVLCSMTLLLSWNIVLLMFVACVCVMCIHPLYLILFIAKDKKNFVTGRLFLWHYVDGNGNSQICIQAVVLEI